MALIATLFVEALDSSSLFSGDVYGSFLEITV